MKHGIWLTVITVVRNDAVGFSRTLHSLQGQDLAGVEFIVIDGSDQTEEIPRILREASVEAGYYWMTPTGIYSAMNDGIARAQGQYSYFANAGDTLESEDVLTRVKRATEVNPEWLFGPVRITSPNGDAVITPSWDYEAEKAQCFSRGHFPCHQGTFVRTQTLRDLGGFSSHYSIVSDYAMFLELSRKADPIHLDFVIANFSEGGVSTVKWRQSLVEFHRARINILDPRGMQLIRERLNTVYGYLRMLAYRSVISSIRRSSA
jgi:glycosyltransferase involved in cell wall biosynthesis